MGKFIRTLSSILTIVLFQIPTIQAQIINWQDFVDKTFVFEIDNKEAEKLLKSKPQDSLIRKMLHTPVAEFTDTWEDMPDQGHFIFANIYQNQVGLQYTPVFPFKVYLYQEYGVLTLQVVDGEGVIRKDAKVRIAKKRKFFNTPVAFDSESQTYRIEDWSEKRYRMLTVELDHYRAVFDLTKYLVPSWYGGGIDSPYSPDFYSYMITDKNRYKPGEHVRFKSYALTGSRRPLKKDLEVWVETENRKYKKISALSPYNPGGYAGEIHLHDSLGMKLDKRYSLQLREPQGKIVARTHFKYEDYVLYDNSIEIELAQDTHYFPETNNVEIMVTDANGLLLPDVQADILVSRRSIEKSYLDVLTVPDTMMFQRITLDNSAPTKVEIPASVFGEADGSYDVRVTVVTVDGQRLTASEMALFYRSRQKIETQMRGDTIRFEYYELGKPLPAVAELFYDKEKTGKKVTLPYEEPFTQSLREYRFKVVGNDFEDRILTNRIDPEFDIEGGIRRDSLNVRLVNPLGLEVSWYIYQGNLMIGKGSGKEMEFEFPKTDLEKAHYVEVFYFMGNSENVYRRTFYPEKSSLNIGLDMPERIYPGQTIDLTATVTDHMGYPVKGADLTAFAYNSLLDYNVPDLPDYGAQPQSRERRDSYSIKQRNYDFTLPVDYAFWKDIASLESYPYYRLAYPRNSMFVSVEDTPDGTTQFAPYVMKNGQSVDVYVIEVNDEPVWFSWTEQTQAYSFPVSPDSVQKITLRMYNRALIFDHHFEPGKKTVLSLDWDRLPSEVRVIPLNFQDKDRNYIFSPAEVKRYAPLTARFPVGTRETPCWLYMKNDSILIYHPLLTGNKYLEDILAGPVPQEKVRYGGSVEYHQEGGFRYEYGHNVVYKYSDKQLPKTLRFASTSQINTLGDFYLSPPVLAANIEKTHRKSRYWSPSNIFIAQQGMNLNFHLSMDADSSGVANLIFLDRENDRIVYPDKYERGVRKYSQIDPGTYDAILLYNNGKYLRANQVPLTKNAYTEIDMTRLTAHPADTLSEKWLRIYASVGMIGDYSLPGSRSQTYYRRTMGRYSNVVSGFVFNPEGEPVIGAAVFWKNTVYGTITNIDGYFELPAEPEHTTLNVSFIGFCSYEATVKPGTALHVILEEDAMLLEEVVIVGYGVQTKRHLTGSVAGISANSMSSAPPESLEDDKVYTPDPEAEERLYRELLTLNGLRSNFSDVGFWEPALVTDRKGKASFSVTFPDNITKWNTVVYAMNRRLKTGTFRQSVRSYKPLMAELRMPQFMVAGDVSDFTGNIRNYTQDSLITGQVTFIQNADTLSVKPVEFISSYPDRMRVSAPETDSLTATYLFVRDDGYSDGEKRSIAVIPQGTEIADGTLGLLREGDGIDLEAGENEIVEVIVSGKQLDVYQDANWYLYGYRYACNEQLASKLIGLLNIRLYNQYEGVRFKHDRQVNNIIRRLSENRNDEQLWSWFGRSSNTSYWMSAHILRALRMAKEQGYSVNLDLSRLENDYTDITPPYRHKSIHDIDVLHALSQWGSEQNYEKAVAYWEGQIRRYEMRQDSIARREGRKRTVSYLNEKLLLWEIRQMQGLEYSPDSIEHYLHKDVLGAVYCDDGIRRNWYYDELNTTLTAYRIVRNDSTLTHYKEPMQMYILGSKSSGWNTYRAASAVGTVFPDLLAESYSKEAPASLVVSGKENRTITRFPYETVLVPGERIRLEKGQGMPLIYSAYSRELVTKRRDSEAFDVKTHLSGGGMLHVGQIDTLIVDVRVKQKNAEHVMIEVPIPAGCDYASKQQYYGNYEVHREHFKEKTVIFCERLPEGEYTFKIPLLSRFSGQYHVNPAKVEMMYFPVISGNNDMRKVFVE